MDTSHGYGSSRSSTRVCGSFATAGPKARGFGSDAGEAHLVGGQLPRPRTGIARILQLKVNSYSHSNVNTGSVLMGRVQYGAACCEPRERTRSGNGFAMSRTRIAMKLIDGLLRLHYESRRWHWPFARASELCLVAALGTRRGAIRVVVRPLSMPPTTRRRSISRDYKSESANTIARPTSSGRTPVPRGSKVPMWPTFSPPRRFRTCRSAPNEVIPAGLSRTIAPFTQLILRTGLEALIR